MHVTPEVQAILDERAAATAALEQAVNQMAAAFEQVNELGQRAASAIGVPISDALGLEVSRDNLQHLVLTQLASYATPQSWGPYNGRYNGIGRGGTTLSLSMEISRQADRLADFHAERAQRTAA